ncbi:hypothetical protein IMAU10576_02740 [Lactiplantibacillus plantarum]|nr:hypothetical protein [Lactiplantibacillus plantarum]
MEKTLSFTDTSPQTVKIGDTTTSFTLVCGNDNTAVDLTHATSITVKLGNASGYLKSAQIDPSKLTEPTAGKITVAFNADLMKSLPSGNCAIEVWVDDSTGTSIYPSDGSTGFTITNNIQSTTGETITTIAFDDFVKELNKAASTIAKGDKGDPGNYVPETFTNLAALKSKYPTGSNGIMVTADTGHKYIWANGAWTDAGVYQSAGLADASVTGAKLDPKIRGLGANIGIAYPTKIQHLEPNALKDATPLPQHFKYLVDIKIYNPDPAKAYIIIQLNNDDNSGYGAWVGYLPKTNGVAISTVGAKGIGTGLSSTFSSTPLAEDQDGFVTSVINDGPTQICVTYNQRQMKQDNCSICHFYDPYSNSWFDCCLIDDACYVGNGFIRPFSQLYHQRIEPNGNSPQSSITPEQSGYVIKKILVINPDPNKLYFIENIYNGGNDAKWGATFGTFNKPDNNDVASVNTSTATLLTPDQLLTDKPVVSADGLITQSLTYNKHTTIIITYDTTKLTVDGITWFADSEHGNYYDNCIIDRINYINLPTVELADTSVTSVKFNKPAWLGDSITEHNNIANIHYHDILSANWKSVRSDNLGIGGSTVGNKSNPMSERYTTIPADADFISVFGGINDYGHDQPLGAYGDVTNDTFYGALRVLCEGLQTKFPQVPKIYISPIHIGSSFGGSFNAVKNGLGFTQKQYEDAIDLITADYGIPHLSLYHNSGVTFAINAQAYIYSVDTLHPNDTGQALIAQKIQQFVNYNFA